MHIKSILSAVTLAACAFAIGQETISFQPHYRKGDVDTYLMTITIAGQKGVVMNMNLVEKVSKVYPNGDADITVSMATLVNGKRQPFGAGKPVTTRVNKYGQPVKGQSADSMGMMGFDPTSMGAGMPHRPMRAGEVVNVNQQLAKGFSVKGTVKIASIVGGVAKLISNEQVTTPQTGSMHVAMIGTMGADAKLRRMEGDITGIMGSPTMKAHIVVTRS